MNSTDTEKIKHALDELLNCVMLLAEHHFSAKVIEKLCNANDAIKAIKPDDNDYDQVIK